MSLWSRVMNTVRPRNLSRDVDQEMESHIAEAIDHGRDPAEARKAFGSPLKHREESRDIRVVVWLDSLRADAIFGWRQLMKNKGTSATAILSLALAIGSCTSAFRLIDGLLLRTLPVTDPERLHVVAFEGFGADGKAFIYDSCSYPMFRHMRAAIQQQAESIAISYADRVDLTYGSDQEMEKAYWQYVSGGMFRILGMRPALGRLPTDNDDLTPGTHPIAVLSHDYWTRRFGQDPKAIGRTFRMGDDLFEIVGVIEDRFTGTETGTVTDIFVPMMMKNARTLASSTNFWLRTLVKLKPGVASERVQGQLRSTFRRLQEENAKNLAAISKRHHDEALQEKLLLEPAAAGRSNLQRDYRHSLVALGILVLLVLLIACANVANLMTAQAAARAREMALRISIGAGKWRLVQLVLVESAWLAFLATAFGALFASWSAPFIVGMIDSPDHPARLALPADWRVLAFAVALALAVTFLFGLAPALHASAVKPAALRGGEDPHSRRRLVHALIALQIAFCFVVCFVAGLLVASFHRLSDRPTGFSAERILNLEAVTHRPQPPVFWNQVVGHLRTVPGVETAALTVWPLMSGESRVGDISVNGAPPTDVFSDFLSISPGWIETMRIPLIGGRDFRASDTNPTVAIVNEAFAKQYFSGANPVGKTFEKVQSGARVRFQIVGFIRDARSRRDLRLPIRPTAYVPFQSVDAKGVFQPEGRGTFVVRTSTTNPLTLASTLRKEVSRARSEFRVTNIRTQGEINLANALRERLLAMLALFFAIVALLLSGVGLYGVLDYTVLQRRREIGIRMAIGAAAGDIARRVITDVFLMILLGAFAGLALGMAAVKYLETLLYEVKASDPAMYTIPALTILAAALLAALPAVIRAMRIDPVTLLRAE